MSYRPSDLLRGSAIPDAVLRALPKTDLHASLLGSLRPATVQALAAEVGVQAPTDPADLDLEHALAGLQTASQLERAAREVAEDAAAAGVRVLELRVCPLLHGREGMLPDAVVAAVQRGLAASAASTGLLAGIVVTGLRTDPPARNQELARVAVQQRHHGVVAFGLGGPEDGYPADDHREAFYHAKNNNLPSTCDAGLSDGPASIHAAIHRCGAARIGHAVRLEEDPALLDFVNDHRIPLEICLASDVAAAAVPSVADHPLRRYHEAGLRVCLNSDGGTDMVQELRLAIDVFDFTLLELEDLVLAGFKSAFMPERAARVLIEAVLAEFARIRDHYRLDALVAGSAPRPRRDDA